MTWQQPFPGPTAGNADVLPPRAWNRARSVLAQAGLLLCAGVLSGLVIASAELCAIGENGGPSSFCDFAERRQDDLFGLLVTLPWLAALGGCVVSQLLRRWTPALIGLGVGALVPLALLAWPVTA